MSTGYTRLSGSGAVTWKDPVASLASLPPISNTLGDARVTTDTATIYVWDGSAWIASGGGGGGSVSSVTGSAPISVTNPTTTPNVSITLADTSTDGYLSSTDWNTFNSKQDPISGTANSFAMYDGSGDLISDLGYKYDPTKFDGLRYNQNVVPDNTNNNSTLHEVFASYNPTLTDADETWSQLFLEAGVGTDDSGNQIGDYTDVKSTLVVQDITYTSKRNGTDGDVITVEYTPGGTAGSEVVTSPSTFVYQIQIEDGVSTATQIITAITNSSNPGDLFGTLTYAVTGTGSNPQMIFGPTNLSGGANANGSLYLTNLYLFNHNKSNMGNGYGINLGIDLGNGTDPVKANNVRGFYGNTVLHDNSTVQYASAFEYGFSTTSTNSSIEGELRGINLFGNPQTIVGGLTGFNLGLAIATAQYVNVFQNALSVSGNITNSVNVYADFSNYSGDIGDNYYGVAIQPNINTTDGFFGVNISPNVTLSRFTSTGVNVNMGNVTVPTGTHASLVIQDLTYTASAVGTDLNGVTIEYVSDTTAGNESAVLVGNAVTVHMESGVSTATQIRTGVLANVTIAANVTITVSGVGSNPQVTAAPQPLTGGTDSGNKYSGQFNDANFQINQGKFQTTYLLDTATETLDTVFNINSFQGTFKISPGFPVTNGNFGILNSLGLGLDLQDDMGPDLTGFGIGVNISGILTQLQISAGKTADAVGFMTIAASVPSGSGSITNLSMFRAIGIVPQGGTISVTNMYGFKVEPLLSALTPTNTWGFWCGDSNANNWFSKNVVIGGSTGLPTGSYALDVIGDVVLDGTIHSTDTNESIDSNNRHLIQNGANVVDWTAQKLTDDTSQDSLKWKDRELINDSGTTVFDWSTNPTFSTELFVTIETFTNQTTPATPASGQTTIFVDLADKHTKQIDDTGTVTDLAGSASFTDATLLGSLTVQTRTVTTTYTVDGSGTDNVIFADTTGAAFSITLPTPTAGRLVTIKDPTASFFTNNLTILPSAAELIDGSASYVADADRASISLISNGTDWFII